MAYAVRPFDLEQVAVRMSTDSARNVAAEFGWKLVVRVHAHPRQDRGTPKPSQTDSRHFLPTIDSYRPSTTLPPRCSRRQDSNTDLFASIYRAAKVLRSLRVWCREAELASGWLVRIGAALTNHTS